ncbi:MAG: 16S rRNA (guanine(527)-N(7))-methyltransferase RsmG [Clostridia bacterium]|nr:16S rRNA (guanine(527)-N(7))-methyltransferase RsmG [Clostridia bacterium]
MEFEAYKALHERIFRENGLGSFLEDSVSRETLSGKTELFWLLTERMLKVNEQMNLTAVRDPESVIFLHYADSLVIASAIPRGITLCDIGCGAGFPSLPLAIARGDLSFYAVDSTEKKVRYVAETAAFLGLSDRFETHSARAEELGQGKMRESFSCVTARAVSNLRMLSELCLPLVELNGAFLSMKGANWETEYKDAENAIALLGGALERADEFEVRNGDKTEKRCLLTIRKVHETPAKYPRAWGRIKSKPL